MTRRKRGTGKNRS